ncbi:MAG: endonuclease, partial [Prevotella sp.]|nr:endonuclease [Prevotella sp.]
MILNLLLGIITFVELNCENLFDTRHDKLKQDQEYLADGVRHWNRHRYWDKVNHIAKEIISCGDQAMGWQLPDFVALCEVENDSVMRDLTQRSSLRNAGYQYVMTDSPDERGIDVALLYSPFSFRLLHSHAIRIEPLKKMRPTRDILYATGTLVNGDTLHVMVVHAPSRFNGE